MKRRFALPKWVKENFDLSPLLAARVWIFMVGLMIVSCWLGYRLGDRQGLMLGFLFATGLNLVMTFYGDWRVHSLIPGAEIEGQDPWGVLRMTRELARAAKIKMPTLWLLHCKTPVAFSAGLNPRRSTVYVSKGLVTKLTEDELRAVLAYEINRLKLDQTRTATAAAGLAGLFEMIAGWLDAIVLAPLKMARVLRGRRRGPFLFALSPALAFLIRMGNSRQSVLDADRATAEALGESRALARALLKLDAYSKTLPLDINLADAPLFVVNPLVKFRWSRLASVQPPVETRVRELTGQFPL